MLSISPRTRLLAWRLLGIALILAYAPLSHYGVTRGAPSLALASLACIAAYLAISMLPATPMKWLLALGVLLLPFYFREEIGWLLYLPPILINLALAAWFAHTLAPNNVPLVSRYAAMEQGTLSAELRRYTRNLTWIWVGFFLLMAIVSAILAWTGPPLAWSLLTNVVNYVLVIALLLGEYCYRRLRYRRYLHHSPWQLMYRIARGFYR